jgi:hypothetical protein
MDGQTKRMNLVIQQFLRNYGRWINKIRWTIWSWLNFATTIRSIWQLVPPPFKWWPASHQLCLQLGSHLGNP